MTDFSAKRVGETEYFAVDFVNQVTIGATIVSATWTNTVKTGVDATPNAMISGPAIINGTQVTTKITAGIAGNVYLPICTAVTSDGETLILPEPANGALPIN